LARIMLSVVAGAGLSVAGVVFQALLRNPLAEPYVLGISHGAGLGTAVAIILARAMACLPQHFSLDLAFTVRELVLMGRSPHLPRIGGETGRDFEIARSVMELADLSHLADRPITEISGGERQRVLIAMCLAQEPEVLLLDEPASHLDIAHQLSVLDLIAKLNRQTGMTVVAVFHDLNLAAAYCQRLLVLNEGRVEALGRPQDVLTAEMMRKEEGP
jgi:iron complex transport system ATP-binding protein